MIKQKTDCTSSSLINVLPLFYLIQEICATIFKMEKNYWIFTVSNFLLNNIHPVVGEKYEKLTSKFGIFVPI